jgi:hypothetical protein
MSLGKIGEIKQKLFIGLTWSLALFPLTGHALDPDGLLPASGISLSGEIDQSGSCSQNQRIIITQDLKISLVGFELLHATQFGQAVNLERTTFPNIVRKAMNQTQPKFKLINPNSIISDFDMHLILIGYTEHTEYFEGAQSNFEAVALGNLNSCTYRIRASSLNVKKSPKLQFAQFMRSITK